MAQVAQVDITTAREFEMTPVIGNHLVKLGNASDLSSKFNRLFVFYRQVMARTGFDAYKLIDVRFRGQVVAVKQPVISKIDSVKLRRNVEELLNRDFTKTDSVSFNQSIAPDKNN
jgi:cell division protein FtsQ